MSSLSSSVTTSSIFRVRSGNCRAFMISAESPSPASRLPSIASFASAVSANKRLPRSLARPSSSSEKPDRTLSMIGKTADVPLAGKREHMPDLRTIFPLQNSSWAGRGTSWFLPCCSNRSKRFRSCWTGNLFAVGARTCFSPFFHFSRHNNIPAIII